MCSRKDIGPILKELFPAIEMAAFLAACTLTRMNLRDAVAYAPVSLARKRDLFLQLASGKDRAYFRRQAGAVEEAIREMQAKPGEFFYLKCCRYSDKSVFAEEKGLAPYLTWEHIFERIQEYLGNLADERKALTWFEVEKWSPDGTGRLKNDYDYTVFGSEVCYAVHNNSPHWDWPGFSAGCDLNLPVPFHAGDIVTIDCRPSAPVSHAVILEVGDNRDCCCLQALYRSGDGSWSTGAVKHGYILPNHCLPNISPLYRLASFHGPLPEKERLLAQVSRHLNGDEERGAALWGYIFDCCDEQNKRTVTEEQILSFLENMAKISPAFKI